MATKKISAAEARKAVGATDWQKVKNMTDADIEQQATNDPATRTLSPSELAQFRRRGTPANKG